MTRVRPTLKAFKQIPEEFYNLNNPWPILRANAKRGLDRDERFADVDLSDLDQNLLLAANRIVENHFSCDRHQAASKAAKMNVYEVRDKQSGWRGALIRDEGDIPWLVYAASHDEFHARVADVLKSSCSQNWMRSSLDYKLYDKEERQKDIDRAEIMVLNALVKGIHDAMKNPEGVSSSSLLTPFDAGGHDANTVRIEAEIGDGATRSMSDLCDEAALVTIAIDMGRPDDQRFINCITSAVHYIQPDNSFVKASSTVYGTWHVEVMITEAMALNIYASESLEESSPKQRLPSIAPPPQPVLHRVKKSVVTEAQVRGRSVMAICGTAFVPSQDEFLGKPLCPACEKLYPIADKFYTLIDSAIGW